VDCRTSFISAISLLMPGPTPSPKAVPPFVPYVQTIPGSNVHFEMMPIPGGRFSFGSPDTERGRSYDEGPQRLGVTIHPFWMGKTEVTWDEYDLFAFGQGLERQPPRSEASPGQDAVTRPTPPYADESFGYGKGRRPAISMTHHAAMEYCRWLSLKTGRIYRLPTEAEWEYACRARSKTAYSFGDDPKDLGEYAWYRDNSDDEPHPVALKKPNAWGLYDMHGNVAEWCLDQYEEYFLGGLKDNIVVEPAILPTERRYPHVVRGGSWDDNPARLRSAARRSSQPAWSRRDPQRPQSIWWHTEAVFVGFRVVRPVEEEEGFRGLRSTVTRDSP